VPPLLFVEVAMDLSMATLSAIVPDVDRNRGDNPMRQITMVRRTLVIGLLLAVGVGCGGDSEVVTSPWNLAEPASGRTLSLVVRVGSSSCNELRDVEVTESADSIRVDATVSQGGGGDCTADDSVAETSVELERDLGDRSLTGCRPDGPLSAGFAPEMSSSDDCRAAVMP
jgi:hypothetical protein